MGNRKYECRKNIQSVGSESGAEAGRPDECGGKTVGSNRVSEQNSRTEERAFGSELNKSIQKLPYHIIGIAGAASPAPSEGTLKTSSRELRLPYSGRVSPAAKGLIS